MSQVSKQFVIATSTFILGIIIGGFLMRALMLSNRIDEPDYHRCMSGMERAKFLIYDLADTIDDRTARTPYGASQLLLPISLGNFLTCPVCGEYYRFNRVDTFQALQTPDSTRIMMYCPCDHGWDKGAATYNAFSYWGMVEVSESEMAAMEASDDWLSAKGVDDEPSETGQ